MIDSFKFDRGACDEFSFTTEAEHAAELRRKMLEAAARVQAYYAKQQQKPVTPKTP